MHYYEVLLCLRQWENFVPDACVRLFGLLSNAGERLLKYQNVSISVSVYRCSEITTAPYYDNDVKRLNKYGMKGNVNKTRV